MTVQKQYDVVVVGSGAAGLTAAITAKTNGLSVIVLEKAPVFGGTTAFSGGVVWIPGNPHFQDRPTSEGGVRVDRAAVHDYMRHEAGNKYDADFVEAYLDYGPEMLRFLESRTEVKFTPSLYPDYHPEAPGGVQIGRSITAAAYDGRRLGKEFQRLRPPLKTITFMGMMFNSSNNDLKHFFNFTKSAVSAAYVAKRLGVHMTHLARYGRGVQLTSGNALAARLAKSAFDLGIQIVTDAPVRELIHADGRIAGVIAQIDGAPRQITAARGVVLAAGGFARDLQRLQQHYPHLQDGGEHFTPVPEGNTGDGIALGEAAGGHLSQGLPNAAAWMPVSKVPYGSGAIAFPHLVDRYKPGFIMVNPDGRRFVNESLSYHDVGAAMIKTCRGLGRTEAWLIADHRTIRKYGIGFVKPYPMPLAPHLRSGYLTRGKTLAELADRIGVPAQALQEDVAAFNAAARQGEDRLFGRGSSGFNRYLGDASHKPNPNVAPVERGPFYALKLIMGDLGTFPGLQIDTQARVLDAAGQPIPGLYAAGNDAASIMGGAYPGAGITIGPAMTFGYVAGLSLAGRLDGTTSARPAAE
ncbi:FAD-dependent oxidoreductase [Paracoccus shanxieyensis]|uniref:FAD-dependent oxidoreductase n=1 Tax=Paracoccus shanxieyensis TaxID=2675752 RepID=A0A6L6J112_9RHOB|nr:FAD-dependent oxidoreductase [Paracoccus shanxieyensis]MTH66486.1 FAD-dependent oxidoreductase [Paracoccus shanxieyensis]MTH89732.1 FAD-dependent oxidoreductase [Paracoccus shanxieyensis]